MPALLSTLFVIGEIAFRNLFASKWKTLIVGGIIGFGAFLVVVGTSIVDGVDRAHRLAMDRQQFAASFGIGLVFEQRLRTGRDVAAPESLLSGFGCRLGGLAFDGHHRLAGCDIGLGLWFGLWFGFGGTHL